MTLKNPILMVLPPWNLEGYDSDIDKWSGKEERSVSMITVQK